VKPGVGVRVLTLVLAVIFTAPTLIVMATSFTTGQIVEFPPKGLSLQWFSEVFDTPEWTDAFSNSFQVGLVAAVLAMVTGTLLAMAAARGKLLPSGLVTALALMPLVVPLVIAGIGFYIIYIRVGLTGSVLSLGIAHAMLGLPFVFVNVLAALTNVDSHVEEAARICGANEITTFLRVTLPLIAPGAIIGGVLAFIASWDEVVVAIFLVTPDFRTIPVVMLGEVRSGVTPATSAVATLVTVVSVAMLVAILLFSVARRRRPWMKLRRSGT
jgi:putative spermidine/putrescine transport system permease protein